MKYEGYFLQILLKIALIAKKCISTPAVVLEMWLEVKG